jgi:transposase
VDDAAAGQEAGFDERLYLRRPAEKWAQAALGSDVQGQSRSGVRREGVRRYSKQELHVVLDNSSTHATPDVKAWLAANPQVHFHYTPTSASWMNQVEGFFGILGKQSLGATDFPSKRALRDHIEAYMRSWNKSPTPFAWTKPAQAIIKSHRRVLKRISTALH